MSISLFFQWFCSETNGGRGRGCAKVPAEEQGGGSSRTRLDPKTGQQVQVEVHDPHEQKLPSNDEDQHCKRWRHEKQQNKNQTP